MKDYIEFMKLSEKIKDTGVVYIGGGVPKDFIQLFAVTANLLYSERLVPNKKPKIVRRASNAQKIIESYYPHKYAIQITTDSPQWGGLSGCTFEEAMSWGKEDINGLKVQLYCDATIALPIIAHALNEKIKKKRKGVNFSFLFN
jgi:deoxyhypusine synthase